MATTKKTTVKSTAADKEVKPNAAKPAPETKAEVKPTPVGKAVAHRAETKPAPVRTAPKKVETKPAAKVEEPKKEAKPLKVEEEKPVKAETAKAAEKTVKAETPAPEEKPVKKAKPETKKKNILFVCSEAFPFAGTGGLGEVMGSLPKEINALGAGYEARIILPLYESFPQEDRANLEFICHINVPLAWRNQYCGLFKYNYRGTVYYFIDNEYYFKRPNLYGYYDDGERFAFPAPWSSSFRTSDGSPTCCIARIGRPRSCPYITSCSICTARATAEYAQSLRYTT